ncbi:MAG: Bacterial rane flanked domain protein [Frankiales bacterium]|nr:Bacterial rane flanked domain protein [Frankiales bacterium]
MITPPDAAWRRPDRALLTLHRRLALLLVTLPGTLVAVVLGVLEGAVPGAAALGLVGLTSALLLLAVSRRWWAWGYLERDDDLVVRRGVLVQRTTLVPYGRMQFVDVTAGPLARRLGLASVTLHTAAVATDASIPGLLAAEATRLRDRLAALGEARQAGV